MTLAAGSRIAVSAIAWLLPLTAVKAQTVVQDYGNAPASPGSWAYVQVSGGSEARFVDTSGTIRLTVGCTRALRQVVISRTSTAPAASLFVWTTGGSRNLPAQFEGNAFRVSTRVPAYDSLLDAVAFSRGRFVVAMPGSPALVVLNAPEPARVVEDCRA